jgi:hypothetical protein
MKMTIDHTDISSSLANFPVLFYLSPSSGIYKDSVIGVFNEIGGYSKKIAVTKSDGITQCYVEIEKWDSVNKKAWLWVNVSSVSSTADTVLYLYYDASHADNTAYVGDVDSTVAQKVWDVNFKGVWHLRETSGGSGAIKDSTSNNNDGTNNGPTLGVTGKIDSATEFDGSDDYIKVSDSAGLRGMAKLTLERWGFSAETVQRLEEIGYRLNFRDSMGVCEAIAIDPLTGWRFGAADPRGDGKAVGY